jgi:hypothetical protein
MNITDYFNLLFRLHSIMGRKNENQAVSGDPQYPYNVRNDLKR